MDSFYFNLYREGPMDRDILASFYDKIKECRCACLGDRVGGGTVRDNLGKPGSGIVLLGEAPGAEEIRTGMPFVGQAGQNLTRYLEMAHLSRYDVYIINTVKCRPTKNNGRANRRPNSCEIKSCLPWLDQELQILSPKVIITLGEVALKKFGGSKVRIGNFHGQPLEWNLITIFPMYHPAASIYRRELEQVIEDDFRKLGSWLQANIFAGK